MAKSKSEKKEKSSKRDGKSKATKLSAPADAPAVTSKSGVDPTLASLFATSLGPIKPLPKSRYEAPLPKTSKKSAPAPAEAQDSESEAAEDEEEVDDEELSELPSDEDEDVDDEDDEEEAESGDDEVSGSIIPAEPAASPRKRKRQEEDANLEQRYLSKLAREELKEAEQQRQERAKKRAKTDGAEAVPAESDEEEDSNDDADVPSDNDVADLGVPQHESLAQTSNPQDAEFEKASRTVFLGNVSITAISSKSAKKALTTHLSSHLASLPVPTNTKSKSKDNTTPPTPHKLLTLRFRSIPFATSKPKKAAFATREIMPSTTSSTHAYAVYSTPRAALSAAQKLNGTIILDRHLRVDSLAHPSAIDHRRCIFVGNLGFVDDTSNHTEDPENPDAPPRRKSSRPPADIEEGLWRTFSALSPVESVRVPRDATTRVGKGFAYVQFKEEQGVDKALLYNDKSFPPMLPRKLRVLRAKSIKRNTKPGDASHPTALSASSRAALERGVRVGGGKAAADTQGNGKPGQYNRKITPRDNTAQGRAARMLGRAGAAQMRRPEDFVFEGHRATSSQGKSGFKFKAAGGGKGKKGVKPKGRSARRGTEWKRNGGAKRGREGA